MKVLTLQGGARKNGNTATVLGWIEEELKRLGHEITSLTLHDKDIRGCLACTKCKKTTDAVGCVQLDDAPAILDDMVKADLVLFTSPLYFWGLAGPLKTFIDRTYSLYTNYHQPDHDSLVKGQRQGLLVTGAGPFENNAEPVFTAFGRMQKPHMAVNAGELYIGSCSTPDKLTEENRKQAIDFARSLAGGN
ncbi:flavodoxin family protein [Desulforhopalus singaporensis]|uniref:NADPH-dependent FMN reductase n=1 Tax=Desulforhopalus singaporensis TaxID=91360 RepID=A0A1H0S466_9BACT|nr:flavodoxin family protein [Desulforhopalus singaporensis]SDP36601.1 NADPH-dependent FMN reductase [Desulforhopalus singaporensis]